jgi:hypothetical protein
MESKELPAPVIIPSDLKGLSRQIEQWRRTRPYRMPMPDASSRNSDTNNSGNSGTTGKGRRR